MRITAQLITRTGNKIKPQNDRSTKSGRTISIIIARCKDGIKCILCSLFLGILLRPTDALWIGHAADFAFTSKCDRINCFIFQRHLKEIDGLFHDGAILVNDHDLKTISLNEIRPCWGKTNLLFIIVDCQQKTKTKNVAVIQCTNLKRQNQMHILKDTKIVLENV